MATINEATLAKMVNGNREYIYPKTITSLVKDGDSTLDITLEAIKNMTAVSSTSLMTNTSSIYIYNNRIYVYDKSTSSWIAKGTLPTFPSTETSLTTSGKYADSKATGDRISALETKVGSNTVAVSIEGYIVTDIATIGTKVPTAATVKSVTDALAARTSTLEGYVGGKNVTTTVEGYIVTNIDSTGTKIPTASTVKSAISSAITTTLASTSSGKAADASAVNTRFTTVEGYVGGQNVTTTIEGYIVSDITTADTKVPTAAAVKSGIEGYIVTNIATTGTKVPTAATVKSVTDTLATRTTTLEGYVGGKNVTTTVEGYIVTDMATAGTKVPTAATVKSFVENHIVESTASTYSYHIYTILDASNNVLGYFDTNGGFHVNGPIYATNI